MRILYVAMKYDYGNPQQGLSFEHNNFFDCLHRMGHEIIYFDFCTLGNRLGKAKMNQRLKEVAAAEKPDLIFTFLAADELEKDVITSISRLGQAVTLNWFADDHWRFDNYSRFWAPCFNWVVTTASSAVPKYEQMGYRNVIKSQWACNHFQYHRLDLPLKYDATFVGQPHGDRRFMVKSLRDAGIDVKCWGTGWESGRLTQGQMIEVFNQSRINLNFSNSSVFAPSSPLWKRTTRLIAGAMDYLPLGKTLKRLRKERAIIRQGETPSTSKALQPQIKGRNFEVPGCGGLMLSGRAENLGNYYNLGGEIICFDDVADLIERCRILLDHEVERAAIADQGYQRTRGEHTYVHRFTEIFQKLKLSHPALEEVLAGRISSGGVVEVT